VNYLERRRKGFVEINMVKSHGCIILDVDPKYISLVADKKVVTDEKGKVLDSPETELNIILNFHNSTSSEFEVEFKTVRGKDHKVQKSFTGTNLSDIVFSQIKKLNDGEICNIYARKSASERSLVAVLDKI
jgi:hypothetical protein